MLTLLITLLAIVVVPLFIRLSLFIWKGTYLYRVVDDPKAFFYANYYANWLTQSFSTWRMLIIGLFVNAPLYYGILGLFTYFHVSISLFSVPGLTCLLVILFTVLLSLLIDFLRCTPPIMPLMVLKGTSITQESNKNETQELDMMNGCFIFCKWLSSVKDAIKNSRFSKAFWKNACGNYSFYQIREKIESNQDLFQEHASKKKTGKLFFVPDWFKSIDSLEEQPLDESASDEELKIDEEPETKKKKIAKKISSMGNKVASKVKNKVNKLKEKNKQRKKLKELKKEGKKSSELLSLINYDEKKNENEKAPSLYDRLNTMKDNLIEYINFAVVASKKKYFFAVGRHF